MRARDQRYLDQARQMQALSFTVHIPLVCFGMAFPVLILICEWVALRTGSETYWTLARRWSRVLVALFAVGVVTGTILSFEMGLLWPNFTGTWGSVFGLGFAIEGFSFFVEAIFIGIYVYGWDRTMVGLGTGLALLAVWYLAVRFRLHWQPRSPWSTGRWSWPGRPPCWPWLRGGSPPRSVASPGWPTA